LGALDPRYWSESFLILQRVIGGIYILSSQAYPVMGVIVIAVVFALGSATWFMGSSPDCRLSKEKRQSILRGENLGVTE
jgi:hypothetical protein